MPAIPPTERSFVVHDPTIDWFLAPAGRWTDDAADALCLSRAEAAAWVARASCEPQRLVVVPVADLRRIA